MTTTTCKNSLLGILCCILLSACILTTCAPTKSAKWPDNSPRKIEVLFLGHDSEHHNSEAYLPILASALADKGINFTYSATPTSLNEENLALYDALMIYANHESITESQEQALLDFVAGGKGFLPIHCASFCFQNSPEYISLVGAQFESHGTGVFQAEVLEAGKTHPVMEGFEAFESWDESYVHTQHNEDRTLLMQRVEGDHKEPWTWTRQYKKGKVFYTASGHDERTWRMPQFQKLLENAIIWSVSDRVKGLWSQLQAFPEPGYTEAVIPTMKKEILP